MEFLLAPPTVLYCEPALNEFVARPWYALSNLAFFIAGIAILARGGKHGRMFGGLALLIGMLSSIYDMTFTYISQLFDLAGMLLLIGYLLYRNLSRFTPKRQLLRWVLLLDFVISLCLIVTLKGYTGNVIFGIAILIYVVTEIILLRAKQHIRPRLWITAFGLFIIGVLFWISDASQLYCTDIGLLNGRAIFHYTNAVTMYLLFRFYQAQAPKQ